MPAVHVAGTIERCAVLVANGKVLSDLSDTALTLNTGSNSRYPYPSNDVQIFVLKAMVRLRRVMDEDHD